MVRARQEVSASFLKKRSKKLLLWGHAGETAAGPGADVFWFFFSKKNVLLVSLQYSTSRFRIATPPRGPQ
jgi:hypothetical protein